jgi:hypothetical protein
MFALDKGRRVPVKNEIQVFHVKKEVTMSNFRISRKKSGLGRILVTAALALTFSSASVCKSDMTGVYSPKELMKVLKKAGGWTPLIIPGSNYQPGTIIRVKGNEVYYVDDLSSCGFPLSEFQINPYTPPVTFTKAVEVEASAIINVKGIKAGPGYSRVSKVRFEVVDQGADAFKLIKLKDWMANPDNQSRMSKSCINALSQPDTYLVNEAFKVSKGKYTLYDKSGVAIQITTPLIKELFQIEPDIKYTVESDGSMLIEQPVYFAVRIVQRIGSDFAVLSRPDGEPETADIGMLEKIFLQNAGKR